MKIEEFSALSERIEQTNNFQEYEFVMTQIMRSLRWRDRLMFFWWTAIAKAYTGKWREVPGWLRLGIMAALFGGGR